MVAAVFFIILGLVYVLIGVHNNQMERVRYPGRWVTPVSLQSPRDRLNDIRQQCANEQHLVMLREKYIAEQMALPLRDIDRAILDIELALRYPHNEMEVQIQRENLDLLNYVYIMKTIQQAEWALQK